MIRIQIDPSLEKRIRPFIPEYLYKYRSMNSVGLNRIFTENEIYFSDPTSFNDPFDCKPYLTIHNNSQQRKQFSKFLYKEFFPYAGKKQIRNEIKNNPRLSKLSNLEYREELFEKWPSGYGIYCLSEVPDDILMWSHYSASHTGICLQFKANKESTIFWDAVKVTYQENYPNVNIMNVGKIDEYFNALATKSTHWEYEQERRIIKIPSEGGSGGYKYDPNLLTGVILGAKITEESKQILYDWLSSHSKPVKVFEAKLNSRKYLLDIPGININS